MSCTTKSRTITSKRKEKTPRISGRCTYMKKEVYTIYAKTADITFIMEDTFNIYGEPVSTECKGFYYGEPTERDTQYFYGKLKATYTL